MILVIKESHGSNYNTYKPLKTVSDYNRYKATWAVAIESL
jgi:hypothetical protein